MDLSLLPYLQEVADFRQPGKCLYPLADLLLLGLCTYLCNGQDYEDMALFAQTRAAELSDLLALPGQAPSHDTFRRVFQRLDPQILRRCLEAHGRGLLDVLAEKQICLDGKKLRGVQPRSKGTRGCWVVNAWVSENRLCVGQAKVDDKSNELDAVPHVLAQLDLTDAVVTLDALGCQRTVAAQIREKQGHYLLALKQNQKTLFEEVADAFRFSPVRTGQQETVDTRGRLEERTVSCLAADVGVSAAQRAAWPGLTTLVRVVSRRTENGVTAEQTRYYLSSEDVDNPLYYGHLARGHWHIENHLHWHLDVTFREDACRVRTGFGPENLSTLRKLALQLLTQQADKLSLQKRRVKAAYQTKYLRQLLA